MKRLSGWTGIAALLAIVSLAAPSAAKTDEKSSGSKYGDRLIEAKQVFQELMSTPDRSVPKELIENAKCVVVIPDMIKGAVGFGARWGSGVMSCRSAGGWSPPVGKVAAAAGPLGRSGEAATDLKLNAEIYSYAKSKGLFAGISLEGSRLAPSKKANEEYYGTTVSPADMLFHNHAPTVRTEAKEFTDALPRG